MTKYRVTRRRRFVDDAEHVPAASRREALDGALESRRRGYDVAFAEQWIDGGWDVIADRAYLVRPSFASPR
ncbi:MAG TPA: hypothetical protein VD962_09820 [Rubricoccaceae bacterium]|nr:hypothetical protein [Rubricoccaceae bacterium]